MERHHRDVPHFGLQLADEAAVATALLSKLEKDLEALKTTAKEQEKRLCKGLHPVNKESTVPTREPLSTPSIRPGESPSTGDDDDKPPSGTADSSSDSTSSDSSTSDEEAPERESLTFDQLQAVREGATALCGQPTLEALIKHPYAWKQKPPTHLASRDRPPSETPAAQLAASLVMADVPPESDAPVEEPDLSDMPELESTPPRPFPKRRKTEPE